MNIDLDQATTLEAWGTSLVGRDRFLKQISGQLGGHRLVTLTGPPGIGKTRLAQETVRRLGGPAHWVEVWPLTADWLLAYLLAEAEPSSQGGLAVLDGCDQLRPTVVAAVAGLLERYPRLTILATAREPLGAPDELAIRVPPLGAESRSDPTILLADRLARLEPAIQIDTRARRAAGQLCGYLEGLPLAVELVAPLAQSLPLPELADRFKEVSKRGRGEPGASVRLVLDLGHELLLNKKEATVYRRLGAFAGRFRPADAAKVALGAGSTEVVDSVARKCLAIRAHPGGSWSLPQSIWEDAVQRLRQSKEERTLRVRHARFFMALAASAAPHLGGPDQRRWADLIAGQQVNIRSALAWSLEVDPDAALGLAAGMGGFWYGHGHLREGRDLLVLTLSASARRDEVRQQALEAVARIAWRQRDFSASRGFLEEGLGIQRELGDEPALAHALNGLGVLAIEVGDYETASERFAESLAVMKALGDGKGISVVLGNLGLMARYLGDREGAAAFFSQSLEQFRRELAVLGD